VGVGLALMLFRVHTTREARADDDQVMRHGSTQMTGLAVNKRATGARHHNLAPCG
jgi:hypothetical protein